MTNIATAGFLREFLEMTLIINTLCGAVHYLEEEQSVAINEQRNKSLKEQHFKLKQCFRQDDL